MGFKFLILGFFGGEKILASNLLGRALNSSSGFFGYSKLMSLFFMLFHLMLSEIFYGSEIQHGIFGGINFGPRIFLGFVWSKGNFSGFDFCPHSNVSVTWNAEYPRGVIVRSKSSEVVNFTSHHSLKPMIYKYNALFFTCAIFDSI